MSLHDRDYARVDTSPSGHSGQSTSIPMQGKTSGKGAIAGAFGVLVLLAIIGGAGYGGVLLVSYAIDWFSGPSISVPDLEEFTSMEGRYTIKLPRGAAWGTERPHPQVLLKGHSYETKDVLMGIRFCDFPNRVDPGKGLSGWELGVLLSVEGRLTSEKSILIDGTHPGLEIEYELPNPNVMSRARGFIVEGNKQRLYQLIVTGPKGFVNSSKAKEMFDSFKLTP